MVDPESGQAVADLNASTKETHRATDPGEIIAVIRRVLSENGGACAYHQMARVAYGIRKEHLPNAERSRLAVSLRHLETRGLVSLKRRWGTLGYGQPEMVLLTDQGREIMDAFSRN